MKTEKVSLHYEILHRLYSLPNIVYAIESDRLSWMGHAKHWKERTDAHNIPVSILMAAKLRGKRNFVGPNYTWLST
jgi:hypothetical protein